MRTISIKDISELPEAAKEILNYAKTKSSLYEKNSVFAFYGELGSGKTTLIKEICKQLGSAQAGSSPTFTLLNEYSTERGKKIFHLDLYRMKNESEIYDIGYEEYLFSNEPCFIEWAEKMEHLLPHNCIRVKIEVKENERIISIS